MGSIQEDLVFLIKKELQHLKLEIVRERKAIEKRLSEEKPSRRFYDCETKDKPPH